MGLTAFAVTDDAGWVSGDDGVCRNVLGYNAARSHDGVLPYSHTAQDDSAAANGGSTLDQRSFVIATYALCGFANLSSVAIQVGGIGALAPTRKSDLARLGMKAVAAGTMANFMSACIAGMLV